MTKAELYKDGARLPEQLSRLLFLEGVIAGRRVLEVGARSDDVAGFLLSLGAARVVCAVEDHALVEHLRSTSPLEQVDFRAVRPASSSRPMGSGLVPPLPADDGAFDLVLDFGLPGALARGENARLADLRRLLSPEGFVVTALPSAELPGLRALFDGKHDETDGPLPSYAALVEVLRAGFPLVQVYFQSLLLGYLFGTFDVEPGGEGIAPQTGLVGHEPEPAGAYVFAFGNAIPVVEDVCLVQIPCAALFEALPRRLPLEREHEGGMKALQAAVRQRDEDIGRLREALALASNAGAHARDEDDVTLRPGAASTTSRGPVDDDAVATLVRGLDEAAARVVDLETRLAGAAIELERAAVVRDALLAERDALAADLVGAHSEHGHLHQTARRMREERDELAQRVIELEQELIALDGQRSRLVAELAEVGTLREAERQRASAELAALDEELARRSSEAAAVRKAVDDASTRAARAEDTASHATARIAALETMLREARQQADERLRDAVEAAEHALRAREAAHASELASLRAELRTEFERNRAPQAESQASAAHIEERARLQERIVSLEADAVRLAEALKVLVAEREAARAEALEHQSARQALAHERDAVEASRTDAQLRANALQAEVTTLRTALDAASEAHGSATADAGARLDDLGRLRRADQRLIGELKVKLAEAQSAIDDVTAQRFVLQGALSAREADAAARAAERDRLAAELRRVSDAHAEFEKTHADVVAELALRVADVERLGAELAEAGRRRDDASASRDALDAARDREAHAHRDLNAAERARAALTQQVADLQAAARAAEETLARAVAERDEARAALVDARATGASAAERLRLDADAREARLRADHDVTRDELGRVTEALLQLETSMAEQRSSHEQARLAADEERSRLQGLLQNGQRILDETRVALAEARAGREHDAAATASAQNAALEAAQSALQETMAELQQARATLAAEAASTKEKLADMQRELFEADEMLDNASADMARLEGEVTTLRRALEDTQRNRADELHSLTQQVDDARAEATRLEALLAERERAVEDLRHAVHDQTEALSAAEEALVEAHADDRDERNALQASLEERSEDLRAALARVEQECRARDDVQGNLERAVAERDLLDAALAEAREGLERERAGTQLLAAQLDEAQRALAREHASAALLGAQLEEAQQALTREHAAAQRFVARLDEAQRAVGREKVQTELLAAQLDEAQQALSLSHDEGQLLAAHLDEAQRALAHERAATELARAQLDDARQTWRGQRTLDDGLQTMLEAAQTRAELLERTLADERTTSLRVQEDLAHRSAEVAREQAALELTRAQLEEAQDALAHERARADLARAQLDEAREQAAHQREQATAELHDAKRAAGAAASAQAHASLGEQAQRAAAAAAREELREEQRARAESEDRNAALSADVAAVRAELRDAQAARDALAAGRAKLAAEAAALHTQLRDAVAARDALASSRSTLLEELAGARTEAGNAETLVESLRTELQGVRESLQMARDDADELARQLEHSTTNATLPPGLADELMSVRARVDAAVASRDAADQQRDAAIADLEAARVSARLESRRRADLEAELQRVRHERDQLAAGNVQENRGGGAGADDVDRYRQQIAELELATRAKDLKIAEQAERIERLTDRIIRFEDVGRGRGSADR